jgi:hypothetical protein
MKAKNKAGKGLINKKALPLLAAVVLSAGTLGLLGGGCKNTVTEYVDRPYWDASLQPLPEVGKVFKFDASVDAATKAQFVAAYEQIGAADKQFVLDLKYNYFSPIWIYKEYTGTGGGLVYNYGYIDIQGIVNNATLKAVIQSYKDDNINKLTLQLNGMKVIMAFNDRANQAVRG